MGCSSAVEAASTWVTSSSPWVIAQAANGQPLVHGQPVGEISAYLRAAPDYPRAAPDFIHGQRANCSLAMLQQTMGNQFP